MDFLRAKLAAMTAGSQLEIDHLPSADSSLEVVFLHDTSLGTSRDAGPPTPRRPHRHAYHELIWTRCGSGRHLIDGEVSEVEPNSLTLIGRGQVHVFERADRLFGAVIRFTDEMLLGDAAGRAHPGWMLGRRGSQRVSVPGSAVPRLEAAIDALAAETRRPTDACSVDLERHLLSTILLWVERFYDASRTQQRELDDADVQLYRRFLDVLERDFARHHDVGHYADALRVPAAALSRALSHVTGRATKQQVADRVMLEAARLLRFTDLTVGEIAFRVGIDDQLYFSRAFKRHYGEAPVTYREHARGQGAG